MAVCRNQLMISLTLIFEMFINYYLLSLQRKQSKSPTTPSSPDTDLGSLTFSQGEDKTHQRNASTGSGSKFASLAAQVSRIDKARSVLIENLHISGPPINYGPPPPKSATLPTSFSASSAPESAFVS